MPSRIYTFASLVLATIVLAGCGLPTTTHELDVTVAGSGSGSVLSTPEGIDSADGSLTASFDEGTEVTLDAAADTGSTFAGFSFAGDANYGCEAGSTSTSCILTMSQSKSVTATFTADVTAQETLTVAVDASGASEGNVTSVPQGIDTAAGDVSADFDLGSDVELTATATVGEFIGWTGGDCDGIDAATCTVTIDQNEPTVTANFADSAPLNVETLAAGGADGTVTSTGGEIDTTGTGSDSAEFGLGSTVDLTATATTGGFAGWTGGDCDGSKDLTCTVTIDVGEPTVTANFNAVVPLEVTTAENGDDAVEFLSDSNDNPVAYPEGWVWADFGRLDLGYDPDHAPVEVGLRFPGVTIPEGARVQTAVIRLTARDARTAVDTLNLTILGQATLDPAVFPHDPDGDPSFNITNRTERTDASTAWAITADWAADTAYEAPDVAATLQEIVDLSGWGTSSQAAVFFITNDDPTSLETRRVYTFDGAPTPTERPTLLVEYVALPPTP